jgi:hypothetical protein
MEFINLAGWQIYNPPFHLQQTTCYGYFVSADKTTLQASVDQFLNQGLPENVCYKVLSGQVLASLVDIGRLSCVNPPQNTEGWLQESDFAFFAVLARLEKVWDVWVPQKLVLFPVFLMVDNPLAVMVGREVFGYPKSMAEISIPAFGSTDPLSIMTLVLENFSPDTPLTSVEVIRVTCNNPAGENEPADEAVQFDTASNWLKALFHHAFSGVEEVVIEGLETVVKWIDHVHEPQVTLVFRKQFPDAVDPLQACYSAIVEAPLRVTGFTQGGLLHGDRTLHVKKCDSLPMGSFLGLPSDTCPVELAFYSRAEFLVELGEIVHRIV